MFEVAKRIIMNDDDNNMLVVSSENKIAWKSCYEKVCYTEFAWINIVCLRQM